jgi:hypothetical protein
VNDPSDVTTTAALYVHAHTFGANGGASKVYEYRHCRFRARQVGLRLRRPGQERPSKYRRSYRGAIRSTGSTGAGNRPSRHSVPRTSSRARLVSTAQWPSDIAALWRRRCLQGAALSPVFDVPRQNDRRCFITPENGRSLVFNLFDAAARRPSRARRQGDALQAARENSIDLCYKKASPQSAQGESAITGASLRSATNKVSLGLSRHSHSPCEL